jgi:hypothetical protein
MNNNLFSLTGGKMAEISLKNVGINDQLPYTKIDVLKATRLNNNFAVSFYQLDYQALAFALTGESKINPEEISPIPVAKVVMDYPAFQQLVKELTTLKENFEKQLEEKG